MNYLVKMLAVFALATATWAGQAETLDEIVAVVEEDVILRSELDSAVQAVLRQAQGAGQQLPSRDIVERQVLESLIMIRLQLQRAASSSIRISDADVERAVQRMAQQSRISIDQMRRTVEAQGLRWSEFLEDMRDQLTIDQLRRGVANRSVNISESEVDLFLENQDLEGEYRLGHILVSVPEGASPAQVGEARSKAERIHQDLLAGANFSTTAITYSDGQNALQGGDLGWRPANQVPTLFENAIRNIEVGSFSRPIRSASGFHIVQVADYREASPAMVDEQRARHIMVVVSELVSSEEALDIVSNIRQRIEQGESFEELAKQYSDDPTSANIGGDLGWFQPGRHGERFQSVLNRLSEGELSEPFQTASGWHIVELTGQRRQDRTEDYERAQAREALFAQKSQEELLLFERNMRDEAYVEYRL